MADKTEYLTTSNFWFECPALDAKRTVSEISGLTITVKAAGGLETAAVGPKGQSMRMAKPTGPATYENVKIKVIATGQDDLYKWFQDVNPPNQGQTSKWKKNAINATVKCYNASNEATAIWEIKSCYPTKYGGPSFKAGDGNFANEELEIVHEGVERIQ